MFLARSDSDFVTGQSMVVDGGSVNNYRLNRQASCDGLLG